MLRLYIIIININVYLSERHYYFKLFREVEELVSFRGFMFD